MLPHLPVLILLLALLWVSEGYSPSALADKISSLPGAPSPLQFNQFSGYLALPNDLTKNMHYWFVESTGNPSEDPLTFWTNGGPGCSGLLGFFTEMGPFRPNKDLTLSLNPYSWNKLSNMVFIESPCGVGFSYSNDALDYSTGDQTTATDNYWLIKAFLQRFPEYLNNSLYIASESYGGHYMPTLASKIVEMNKFNMERNSSSEVLNFKGFVVGNPYTTVYSGTEAMLETFWNRQLVSKISWDSFVKECLGEVATKRCDSAFRTIYMESGDINPYAMDFPVCESGSALDKIKFFSPISSQSKQLLEYLNSSSNDVVWNKLSGFVAERRRLNSGLGRFAGYEPCSETYTKLYLNQDNVKQAIHVQTSIIWDLCSDIVHYSRHDGQISMVPIYQELAQSNPKLRILVFSGDDDTVCATIGTQSWIWDMDIGDPSPEWREYKVNGQSSGYASVWPDKSFAFVTVHNAGHEVPAYAPAAAYTLWKLFLDGFWTCDNVIGSNICGTIGSSTSS